MSSVRHALTALYERLVFFALAALIGAVVGLSTLLLIGLILLVQWLAYGAASELHYSDIISAQPYWRVILMPALGGLLLGILMQYLPGRRYHGISDVMEACALNSARMPARSGLGAGLAAGISLGVGAPLGREGPAVHIGASISAWLAEKLQLDHKQSLALLGCGAAAAVAVSFNTPIAAVIFALEVVVGYYTLRVFAPLVIATMLAMLVRHAFLGDEALFQLEPHSLVSNAELGLFAVLGVLGALVAKSVLWLTEKLQQIWTLTRCPPWLLPALAGLLIGVVAIPFPLVLGIGLEGTTQALDGAIVHPLLLGLLLAKWFVVCLALSSGFAGGVFGPAVFLGAMLGGLFWALLSLTGWALSEHSVYVTIGIASVASALLGAPISTVLIVFELTRDYGITLGVMTAAAVASTVMQSGRHGSFFRWQLARRQINLSQGRDISLLITRRVEPLLSTRYLQAPPQALIAELTENMASDNQRIVAFIDADGLYCGSATLYMLFAHAIEHGTDTSALEAAIPPDYAVSPMTNIVSALQVMAQHKLEFVPVVDVDDQKRPVLRGIVTKSDLLAEHYNVVKRARADEFGVT